MRRLFSLFFSILFLLAGFPGAKAQQTLPGQLIRRGEFYFKFPIKNKNRLQAFRHYLSIDKVAGDTVFAYADKQGFLSFRKLGIPFLPLTPPSLRLSPYRLKTHPKSSQSWDFYPSYDTYLQIMQNFRKNHPAWCEIVSVGKTVKGRDLLFAHIGPLAKQADTLPKFMYTSTMHGDETTGYILMLHLIDYMLNQYGKDSLVTHLMDSLDIWINPLANPDGTYAGGNSSVYGATRFNANHVDLNRNYPDPQDGQHPDGKDWQPETKAFMQFAATHHFTLSCNLHTGSEVANYPWDTWPVRSADDAWWQKVCRQYADTVHAHAPNGYFTDLNDGITNGYDWYSISGGRQDYMNYFQNDREFTLELSSVKMPDPSRLPDYWNYNYRSLLNYMHQTLEGLRGKVTDSLTGKPLYAEVFTLKHDTLNAQVYSDSVTGKYFRPIFAGTYDFRFSAQGYQPKVIRGIRIAGNKPNILNIRLQKDSTSGIYSSQTARYYLFPNPVSRQLFCTAFAQNSRATIITLSGKILFSVRTHKNGSITVSYLPKGCYFLKVVSGNNVWMGKFIKR